MTLLPTPFAGILQCKQWYYAAPKWWANTDRAIYHETEGGLHRTAALVAVFSTLYFALSSDSL